MLGVACSWTTGHTPKGGHVPYSVVHLLDIKAIANTATALGDLCMDKVECDGLVQCGIKI